jgi:precorrin-6A/cobalt-precorrin-6A reductase
MKKILVLGGTAEARQLAGKLAARHDVTLSLAGRTENPVAQGVPVRVGGFGGAEGLAAYLTQNRVDLLVDATHPYAARISANAAEAARLAGIPAFALRRPAWQQRPGDRWAPVESAAEAVTTLGSAPRKIFLALGRQELAPFEAAPHHAYLIRSVDPVEPPLAVPDATYILARGPFSEANDRALLEIHGIDAIVSKNSGGQATYGKIAAARKLGIEVFLIRRPPLPELPSGADVEEVLALADHALAS